MTNLQQQISKICRIADAVIRNPSTPVTITVSRIDVSDRIMNIFGDGSDTVYGPPPSVLWPLDVIWDWLTGDDEEKKKQQEKERMFYELIRRQQAIIDKLKEERDKERKQNAKNRQEIEQLKEILSKIEETIKYVQAA